MEHKSKINQKAWRWLHDELPGLIEKNVVTDDEACRLREYYGEPAKGPDGVKTVLVLFSVLAALLIGGGVILILAHNWDMFPRYLRVGFAFLPLLLVQGLGGWCLAKGKGSVWREGIGVFQSLAVCAAISLVAQVYHISGDFARFILVWGLLTLPMVYLFRSSAAALVYMALTVTWFYAGLDQRLALWPFWLLFAAVIPHLAWSLKKELYSTRSSCLLWGGCLAMCVVTGGMFEHCRAGYMWPLGYGCLYSLFYFYGRLYTNGEVSMWRKPLISIGTLGIVVLSLVFSFKFVWRELNSYWYHRSYSMDLLWVHYVIGSAVAAAVVWGAYKTIAGKRYSALLPGGMFVVTGAAWCLNMYLKMPLGAALLFNIYLLALGVFYLLSGVKRRALFGVNAGMLLIGLVIIFRFFDSDFGLLVKGIAFILVGVGCLIGNFKIVKHWRTESGQGGAVK